MNDPSTIVLSSQVALLRMTDMLANNLSNLSTNGFKGQEMLFEEYLGEASDGKQASYVQDIGTARDLREGPITQTNNPLDVAIQGSGYLVVQTPLGPRYTRDGHFQIDAQGQIVTSQGYAVQSDANTPIVIPDGTRKITIGKDGSVVTADGAIAGKLQLVDFADDQKLLPVGSNLFSSDQTPQPASANTTVAQGALEGSNVEPVLEITRLIAANRALTYNHDFTNAEATRVSNAIDHLGKTV
ncbi:MAG TPA: flagellar basal-body rod protein FlgF [Stellaceae bacterium]|nr:flagellar basal-body rod protein FlgF [Stellaceae bacterium]